MTTAEVIPIARARAMGTELVPGEPIYERIRLSPAVPTAFLPNYDMAVAAR
jgi:hypothetical protein